jgi:hypothetical protein
MLAIRSAAAVLAFGLLAFPATAQEADAPAANQGAETLLIGAWAYINKDGRLLNITMAPDGRAASTWWDPEKKIFGDTGAWKIAGDVLTLTFSSGWRDVIKPAGDGWVLEAWPPNTQAPSPAESGPAQRVGPPLGRFVGAWQARLGEPWGQVTLILRSDGTAQSSESPATSGKWEPSDVDQVASLSIGDGLFYTLTRGDEGFTLRAWESGAPRVGEPTAQAPALRLEEGAPR